MDKAIFQKEHFKPQSKPSLNYSMAKTVLTQSLSTSSMLYTINYCAIHHTRD